MIEEIKNFLIGGVGGAFTSLKDVAINILDYIFRIATNGVIILINPIISSFTNVPFLDDLLDKLNYVFDFVSPYINYILDLTFLSNAIISYIVLSLIGRIIVKNSSYIVKILIQWYEKIVP